MRVHTAEPPRGAGLLIVAVAVTALAVFIVLPLVTIVVEALSQGLHTYVAAITDPMARDAMLLTGLVLLLVVPFHAVFGVLAAWTLTQYEFRGKQLLFTIIDLPFAVSPVVSGLLFVLLFGARSTFGAWLTDHGIKVIYAVPGIVIATLFVTLPFVTRELVPLLQAQGREEEEAAASLGASWLTVLWRVTLPRIKWALFYGCVLCAARAAGEFGAVSVVSGHVRGETNTLPLHVEVLYNEYQGAASFSVASLLALCGLASLVGKAWLERRVAASR